MATTRERLHEMLDDLPDDLLDDAARAIRAVSIPFDDEPFTEEDREAIRLGREEYRRGETIPHDQAMREIGL